MSKVKGLSHRCSTCRVTVAGESHGRFQRHGLFRRTVAISGATRMGSTKNAWTVLGLREDATQTEIKNKYRKLVATEHPDKNPDDPLAETKFKEILTAYKQLTEPQSQSRSAAADDRPVTVVVVTEPLSAESEEVLRKVNTTRQNASAILRVLVTAALVLGLLTQPLGFWAADEITNKCVTGNIDRQWCGQLVQLRCVGEFAFGNVQTCVSDGRKLIVAASNEDALPDGRRIVMRLDDLS